MHAPRWTATIGALALAVATAVAITPTAGHAASSGYAVAPYTDMSNSQESLLDTAITGHGLKQFTAAFVIGTGCTQIWGDTLPVGDDPYTDPEIAKAESEGASMIVSSGGAAGEPLAWTCDDQGSIEAGYQKIIDSYGIDSLDFDVEGAAVANTAAAARQMTAMKDLKAADPGLRFSMTLPVLPSGLTADGVNILKAAKNAGIRIDVVNIMTMDYYQGTSTEMGAAAIAAAKATLAQMRSVDSGYSYANLGITPMIGVNDDGSTFTLADAQTVANFAATNGVGRLSFWSVNRDQPCGALAGTSIHPDASSTCSGIGQSSLAFTDAFGPGSGGGGGSTSNFSLALSAAQASVQQGGSATATVRTATTSGDAESVRLSASGAPSGVDVSFQPGTVTSGQNATMSVQVGSSVAAGTYPITVTGTAASGSHSATYALTVTTSGGGGGTGALVNGGFETGGLSPWTCRSGGQVTGDPVHSGSHALQVAPTSSATGECDQTITLAANHDYTLTGWVQGSYAYLGVSGGASASAWANGDTWTKLSVPFTTGADGTVTVYVHGWYGQGNVTADDLTVS